MSDFAKLIMIVAAVLLIVGLFPLAVIWALNTLFGLAIEYTVWTWLAAVVLSSVISPFKHKQ
jgi:hypothetical protein